jgi:hypothetical protein
MSRADAWAVSVTLLIDLVWSAYAVGKGVPAWILAPMTVMPWRISRHVSDRREAMPG